MKWYVVNVLSGKEAKAKAALDELIERRGLQDRFGEVLIPTENIIQLVKGQKKTASKKFFPGYIFVQMDLNEETWHLVKNANHVTGFVGGKMNPPPIPEHEVERLTKQMEVGAEKPRPKVDFIEGDSVRVIDGPFSNFSGSVEEINLEKGKVKVLVSIFGRPTPVELDFVQVEKN